MLRLASVPSPPVHAASDAESAACAACGNRLEGRYCSACGERAVGPEDESLAAFLREQFHEVTSADGRLWRTFKALFVPGKLTAEYFAGRRGLYPRPVRIFLVLNVVLFFYFSGNSGTIFKGPLEVHLDAPVYGSVAEAAVRARLGETGTEPERFETAFDARAQALAPSLIGVLVPALAVLFALLMWPARASGVRHLVLATHTVAAIMATLLVLMTALSFAFSAAKAGGWQPSDDSIDPVLMPSFLVVFSAYLAASFRRVYRVPWIGASAAGIAVATVGLFAAFVAYQAVLFAVTLWTLDVPA